MKRVSIISVLVATLLSSCVCIKSAFDEKWYVGEWEGVGHQIDGKQWDIDLNIHRCGEMSINYPSLSCSGTWELLEANGVEATLKETILLGVNNCDQGVDVELKHMDKNTMEVRYYLAMWGPEPIAYGELKRK